MNRKEAIAHGRKLCEHIKSLDSDSDDWKCIEALLVLLEITESVVDDAMQFIEQEAADNKRRADMVCGEYRRAWGIDRKGGAS